MQNIAYEERIHTKDNGSGIETIRLFDLRKEVVFDYDNDPYRLYLRDTDSDEALVYFDYGQDNGDDDFGIDGLSFSVSPRHNYLIVKEIQYGISLDTVYATLYCLKQPPVDDLADNTTNSSQYQSHFTSHHFLTLLFSQDEHENTIWVHGQQIDRLTTIDVYKHGGYKECPESGVIQPKMFIETAYPAVPLENLLRYREFSGELSGHDVVNTLDKISEQDDRELCQLKLNGLLPLNLDVMRITAKINDKTTPVRLCHSFIGSRIINGDLKALQAKVKSLGMSSQLLDINTAHEKPVSLLFVFTPIAEVEMFNHQSIELMNQLAQQYLVIYDGFQLATPSLINGSLITWEEQPILSYGYYRQLSALLIANSIKASQFYELFNRLMMKHQIHGLWELFTPTQQNNIDDIALVLSQFDDYDKTDEEVVTAVQHVFFFEQD